MKIKTKQNQRYRAKANREKPEILQDFSIVGFVFTFEESF
jgi:hypothetical protein